MGDNRNRPLGEEILGRETEPPRLDASILVHIDRKMEELRREIGLQNWDRQATTQRVWPMLLTTLISGALGALGGFVGSYQALHSDVAALKQAQVDINANVERLYHMVEPRYRGAPDGN